MPTTAAAALLAALSSGVRDALDDGARRDRPPIVHEVDDDWPGPERAIELHLEPGRPEDSWAVIRPWLLRPVR